MALVNFDPIGVFHGGATYKYEAPRQGIYSGGVGRVELSPSRNFEMALRDLEGFERIWLLFVFDRNGAEWRPTTRPPIAGPGPERVGTFASRSPYRPNPIGLSCVRLVSVKGRMLEVDEADLLDGSPILDIKPYLPAADAFPEAKAGWVDLRQAGAWRVVASELFSRQAAFVREAGGPNVEATARVQLSSSPFDASRKRVTRMEENEGTLSLRMFRLRFCADEATHIVTLVRLESGYAPEELRADEDPYADKALHRGFLKAFPAACREGPSWIKAGVGKKMLSVLWAFCLAGCLWGETLLSPGAGARVSMRRTLLGVNHLAYGRDGYGLLVQGRHEVEPELVALQRTLGIRSMRYPGGCGGTHTFKWRQNAGLAGPYHVLGVNEFLGMCRDVGAAPMLGISALRGSPEEAAAYVAYLCERGWTGCWFEYGNETYHGSHPKKGERKVSVSPCAYAERYLAFRSAMKREDPTLRLGAVMLSPDSPWDRRVLATVGTNIDFLIIHTYGAAPVRDESSYMELFTNRRAKVREQLRGTEALCADPRVPIAVTEFNAHYKDHKTLTAALLNLETMFVLACDPRVEYAHYWQFVNEGFGMVRGTKGAFVKRPNALALELYARYTLDEIAPLDVQGRLSVGEPPVPVPEPERGSNWLDHATWRYVNGNAASTHTSLAERDGVTTLVFTDNTVMNFFHVGLKVKGLPKGDSCCWRLSAEMRARDLRDTAVAIEVVDGRGWNATHSAVRTAAAMESDWQTVSCIYEPLRDNPGVLEIRLRREGAEQGLVQIRNLRLERREKVLSIAPVVSGQLSYSHDGSRAGLVLNNLSFAPETVTLDQGTFRVSSARGESLIGPSAYATNERVADAVKLVPVIADIMDGRVKIVLPPYSATGLLMHLH